MYKHVHVYVFVFHVYVHIQHVQEKENRFPVLHNSVWTHSYVLHTIQK